MQNYSLFNHILYQTLYKRWKHYILEKMQTFFKKVNELKSSFRENGDWVHFSLYDSKMVNHKIDQNGQKSWIIEKEGRVIFLDGTVGGSFTVQDRNIHTNLFHPSCRILVDYQRLNRFDWVCHVVHWNIAHTKRWSFAFARGSNPISPSSFYWPYAVPSLKSLGYSIEMKNYSFGHLACYEYQWNPFVILNDVLLKSLVFTGNKTQSPTKSWSSFNLARKFKF